MTGRERIYRIRAALHLLQRFIACWEGDPMPSERESKDIAWPAHAALDEIEAELEPEPEGQR